MRKSEQDNRFYAAKTEAPPLTTTGFELIQKKVALGGISKRAHDITGYVSSRMVRPKSLRKIVKYTQPVLIAMTLIDGKCTACVTTGYDTAFIYTLGA